MNCADSRKSQHMEYVNFCEIQVHSWSDPISIPTQSNILMSEILFCNCFCSLIFVPIYNSSVPMFFDVYIEKGTLFQKSFCLFSLLEYMVHIFSHSRSEQFLKQNTTCFFPSEERFLFSRRMHRKKQLYLGNQRSCP